MRRGRVDERVVGARRLRQAGEQRRLRQRQLLRGLVEERVRRGLDAVGALAVEDGVEVGREDLGLRVLVLQLHGDPGLVDLAAERAAARLALQVEVLRELLRDRRAALADAARLQVVDRPRGRCRASRARRAASSACPRPRRCALRIVGAMSFQRTLTRFSMRAITPSASSWHGLRVQSRAYTLEFSPSSTGPRRESFGRWSMNAAVAASPATQTETRAARSRTKRPMPARAWRASPALALAAALARVAGQRPVVEATRRGGGRQACSAPVSAAPRAQLAPRPRDACSPEEQRPRTSIVTASAPTSRTMTSTSRRPASPARSRSAAAARSHSPAGNGSRARARSRRLRAACCSRSPSARAARSGTRPTCRPRCAAANRTARSPRPRRRTRRSLTRSPRRIGWLNASTMPATTFESVPCAARPMTTATTAVDANTALA